MKLTFCLGDSVANRGADVMYAVIRKDQGQTERGSTIKMVGFKQNACHNIKPSLNPLKDAF